MSDSDEEASCPGDLDIVNSHLDVMNSCSDEVNTLQESLNKVQRQRADLAQRWTAQLVCWAQSLGRDRLVRATKHAAAQRHCEDTLKAVGLASKLFMKAVDAGTSEDKIVCLRKEHARRVSEFQVSKHQLVEVQRLSQMSPAAVKAATPYFIAEDEYLTDLRQIEAYTVDVEQLLLTAKGRYRGAMNALEALSDSIHQQRAEASMDM